MWCYKAVVREKKEIMAREVDALFVVKVTSLKETWQAHNGIVVEDNKGRRRFNCRQAWTGLVWDARTIE